MPMKNEITSNRKLLTAIRQESIARRALEELRVSKRNIGLFPERIYYWEQSPENQNRASKSFLSTQTSNCSEYSAGVRRRSLRHRPVVQDFCVDLMS